MRRFFLLVMLVVLPLQFGMAAVADALEHVSYGHDHHVAASKIVDLDDADDAAPNHLNCEACQFAHSLAHASGLSQVNLFDCENDFPAVTRDVHAPVMLLDRPHRPKWRHPV